MQFELNHTDGAGLHMLLHHLQVQVLNREVQMYSPQTIIQTKENNILHNFIV